MGFLVTSSLIVVDGKNSHSQMADGLAGFFLDWACFGGKEGKRVKGGWLPVSRRQKFVGSHSALSSMCPRSRHKSTDEQSTCLFVTRRTAIN
jgi:hypothetical protein